MLRLITLISIVALSTISQAQTRVGANKLQTPPQLQHFYQLRDQSLRLASSNQVHDSIHYSYFDQGQWIALQSVKLVRDLNGKIVQVLQYQAGSSGNLPDSRFDIDYQQSKIQRQSFKTRQGNQWQEEMVVSNQYDSRGQRSSTSFSLFDTQGQLQMFFADSIAYNYNNGLVSALTYSMGIGNNTGIEWIPILQIDQIMYNAQQEPQSFSQAEFEASSSSWLPADQFKSLVWGFGWQGWEKYFGQLQSLDQSLEADFSPSLEFTQPTAYMLYTDVNGVLKESEKAVFTQQNGRVASIKHYRFDENWMAFFKEDYAYNAQGEFTSRTQFEVDNNQLEIPTQRDERYYQQGKYAGEASFFFITGQWLVNTGIGYNYQFNALGNVSEVIISELDPSGSWLPLDKLTYHYPAQSLSVTPGLQTLTLKAFPNPCTEQLHLQSDEMQGNSHIRLLNLQGQLVMQQAVNGQEINLDLQHIPAGLYLLQWQNATHVGTQRIVKQ